MQIFDHAKLVARDPVELKRFRGYMRSLAAGDMSNMGVMHEDDSSCCSAEDWAVTALRIQQALKTPTRTITVEIDTRPQA